MASLRHSTCCFFLGAQATSELQAQLITITPKLHNTSSSLPITSTTQSLQFHQESLSKNHRSPQTDHHNGHSSLYVPASLIVQLHTSCLQPHLQMKKQCADSHCSQISHLSSLRRSPSALSSPKPHPLLSSHLCSATPTTELRLLTARRSSSSLARQLLLLLAGVHPLLAPVFRHTVLPLSSMPLAL